MAEPYTAGSTTTIFDDVFHTIAQNLPRLMIALINVSFGTCYPDNVEYRQTRNEHYHRSGKVITDFIMTIQNITYHMECQSNPDGTMVLRMMEYDFMIAFEQVAQDWSNVLRLPSSCVVYLRHTRTTPDEHRCTILGAEGQSMDYRCRVIKAQNFTLDEMFEKNLLMLLPFYIMRYEKQFPRMEGDAELRARFLAEVKNLSERLEGAIRPEEKALVYPDLLQLITDVAEYELKTYQETLKGVKEIMGGKILPLPSDSIREAWRQGVEQGMERGIEQGMERGIAQGMEQGIAQGIERERHVRTDMLNAIVRNLHNKGFSVNHIAEMTEQTVETVTSSLRVQGIAV